MTVEPLDVARCAACHAAFFPGRDHCPRCGSRQISPGHLPATGRVLAATELQVPPAGWSAPHRLVLVELEEGVRLLATAADHLPERGNSVTVRRDGAVFRIVH